MVKPNRMRWDPGDVVVAQCNVCIHAEPDGTCRAFPDGIPGNVLRNEVDHRKPIYGDGGTQFEARPGLKHPLEG